MAMRKGKFWDAPSRSVARLARQPSWSLAGPQRAEREGSPRHVASWGRDREGGQPVRELGGADYSHRFHVPLQELELC